VQAAFYLTLQEVLELHRVLIDRFGGEHGIRDEGLIDAALARCRSDYYPSLADQAAALLQSFASVHAFVDGNKRGACASAAIFLRVNGYRLVVSAEQAENFIVQSVIIDRSPIKSIAQWLSSSMKPA